MTDMVVGFTFTASLEVVRDGEVVPEEADEDTTSNEETER